MNLNQLTNKYKSLYLQVSGGADSALGLYLICKHITENSLRAKVTISTWVEPQPDFPRNDKNAKKVVSIISDMFPGIIGKHNIHQLTGYTREDTWEPGTFLKYDAIRKFKDKARGQLNTTNWLTVGFVTAGPPLEIVEKNARWYDRAMLIGPGDRFSGKKENDNIRARDWTPFVNMNKKDTAKLYEEHDLMETLFPYTASCVGGAWHTNNFTMPCYNYDALKSCFWCYEKEWAFEGLVDQPEAYNL